MESKAEIQKFFNTMVETEASDLYLTVAKPPMYRIDGKIRAIGDDAFSPQNLMDLSEAMLNEKQRKDFGETLEMNMAMSLPGVARFRVNIFRQRGSVGMVIRRIKAEVMSLDEMGLPSILKDIVMTKRGLVLVVGATGSGKSTSLAAMIDHRNSSEAGHIITIEDPIEFVHRHKQSIVTQREVGFDTHSFQSALKNTLRQAPDVILIGEIRDTETMEAAIAFAETGHLCLGTLHSNNGDLLAEVAALDAGIVFEPAFIVGPDVRAGRLVPLLQDFEPPPVPIFAVYPSRKHLSAKVRRFVEFLTERFANAQDWNAA